MKLYIHTTVLLIICLLRISVTAQQQDKNRIRTLIIFFDGLRPDYITNEHMPNLYAFKQKGAYGKEHHSVFPTVTRVNASSYSTGSYPGTHGLLGNSVYFPEVSNNSSLNTGDAKDLDKIVSATNGHLLTSISLGEILQSQGKRMMVFSSGSTGQAMMQNHTVSGGAIINPSLIRPESMKDDVIKNVGPIPANEEKGSLTKHKWAADALIYYGLAENGPAVSAIWFSDPDGTAHSDGIGSATAMASIKYVDEQFGRILNEIEKRGMTNSINIVISTDHGFVTHAGKQGLQEFLIAEGFKKDKASDDVVLAGGAIYIKDHDKALAQKIITALQSQEWVGAIFTKGKKKGDSKGWAEGTLSYESIHWDHERSADILVDVNWDDQKNSAGYEGRSYSRGVAGHGSLSPYEVRIPLIVSGPGFKKTTESDLPTSNVDIVPTILHLQGIAIPKSMDGRVMFELLSDSKSPAMTVKKETLSTEVKGTWGSYQLQLERSVMGRYQYVNFSRVKRVVASASVGGH
jgi:predicted AlkP superfamily pyrophosphatase or phosphodiesterase